MPLLVLHHALCTSQDWEGYADMVGGKYFMPDFTEDSSRHSDYAHDLNLMVRISGEDHPVTEGVRDFRIVDEGYSNIWVKRGVTPLLECDHPESSPVMGWVHRHQNSPVVYLMLGHDKQAYGNPGFETLLDNSIHWLSSH